MNQAAIEKIDIELNTYVGRDLVKAGTLVDILLDLRLMLLLEENQVLQDIQDQS